MVRLFAYREIIMVKRKLLLLLIIISLILCACHPSHRSPITTEKIGENDDTAQFHFIDVGQGDCTLIRSGETSILIDCGTYESGGRLCEYLQNLGIKSIDYLIGTHPHEDHLGGSSAVLRLFDVKNVFLNGEMSSSYFFERMVDVLEQKNITPYIPDIGKKYTAGPFEFEFLSPETDFGDENHNSLVVMVKYKDIKTLVTGDIERPVESYLVNHGKDLSADILKVAHHGSRNGSSSEFLRKVNPSIAVIQCGKDNSYGHPHYEVLKRLENTRASVLRTDENGSIVIRTDGKKLYNASEEVVPKESTENGDKQKSFIGNIKSMVVHSRKCRNLPSENNRIYFDTKEEALNINYKPCGNCNP